MQLCKTFISLLSLLPLTTVLALPSEIKLPHLPKEVRDDLLKRHPSTYTVGAFGEFLTARDVQGILETHAEKRGRLEGRASQNNGLKTRCRVSIAQSIEWKGKDKIGNTGQIKFKEARR